MQKLFVVALAMFGMTSDAYSQVQVSQEPRHHIVLENEWVRVLDVRIPPHDTTLMHKHSTPSVFVVLSNTKSGSEVLIEPGKPASTTDGIWFEGFYDKPRVHRVWNEDTIEFHVMDIELLHHPSAAIRDVDSLPFCQSLFDVQPVHAFKMILHAKQHVLLNALAAPVLVIGLSGPNVESVVNGRLFRKKGDFLFVPANSSLEITNTLASPEAQFAFFYLK